MSNVEAGAAPETFARMLVDRLDRPQPTVVTWLNHYSAMRATESPEPLGRMDYVGIDGLFLRRLLPEQPPRTSADTVLPIVLRQARGARVAVVGGRPEGLPAIASAVRELLPPSSSLVAARDGYGGLPRGDDLQRFLTRHRPDILIVGLGPDLQNEYALEAASHLGHGLVATCGGWLDQVTNPTYYPAWAYPLRLNWLVRLVREPRRLWRRYTVDAVQALQWRDRLSRLIGPLFGYRSYVSAFAGGDTAALPAAEQQAA